MDRELVSPYTKQNIALRIKLCLPVTTFMDFQHRDKETIEKFLHYFCYRDKIERREGNEIMISKNEKYHVDKICIPVTTITEVIDYGIK